MEEKVSIEFLLFIGYDRIRLEMENIFHVLIFF